MRRLRPWERFDNRLLALLSVFMAVMALGVIYFAFRGPSHPHPEFARRLPRRAVSDTVIELSAEQAAMLNFVEEGAAGLNFVTVAERDFTQEIHTIGSVDYNQNRIVTIYAHYQGRIEEARGNIGDPVEKGDFLFSMQSPDLLAAEEALISGAGSSVLQGKTLARARALLKIGGISEMAADQAASDEQTAQGSVRSARANVRIFGKTDSEIDRVIAERRVDPLLVVKSPISGVIVARGASPGQFVQPGSAPAPYTVADTSTMWLVANVVEEYSPLLQVGQMAHATVAAFPGKVFEGKISVLGASLDPVSRRMAARVEIADPERLLRAGMFADMTIQTGDPIHSMAIPESAVYREGDGAMTVWTTKDKRRFIRKYVKTGKAEGGFVQILSGIKPGDTVVSDGVRTLSKMAHLDYAN